MIIRKGQMDGFSDYMYRSFEDRMLKQLTTLLPRKVEKLGEDESRRLIRKGVDRAAEYDIETEQDVGQYINLMFLINVDFDTHAELPWVGPILNDQKLDGSEKMKRIHKELPDRLRELGRQAEQNRK